MAITGSSSANSTAERPSSARRKRTMKRPIDCRSFMTPTLLIRLVAEHRGRGEQRIAVAGIRHGVTQRRRDDGKLIEDLDQHDVAGTAETVVGRLGEGAAADGVRRLHAGERREGLDVCRKFGTVEYVARSAANIFQEGCRTDLLGLRLAGHDETRGLRRR